MGRQRLEQALEARRGAEEGEEFKPIRHGWCLGEETFRQELLAQMSERMGAEQYGEERAQTPDAMAEQIIAEELKRRRWKEAELRTRPRGDAEKVALAARLRAETTMTVGWIAERLGMGTRGYLNHLLYRQKKSGGKLAIIKNRPLLGQTAPRGGHRVDQPDLQPGPLRTDCAVEAAATNRRLNSEDQNPKRPKTHQSRKINRQENTNRRSRHESIHTENRTTTINPTPKSSFRRFPNGTLKMAREALSPA